MIPGCRQVANLKLGEQILMKPSIIGRAKFRAATQGILQIGKSQIDICARVFRSTIYRDRIFLPSKPLPESTLFGL
jgi:hypothetical protein